jgi:hypothetical protein
LGRDVSMWRRFVHRGRLVVVNGRRDQGSTTARRVLDFSLQPS